MDIFSDFFASLVELTKSLDFGIVINKMYSVLPDQIINTIGLCFCLCFLGWVISFLKGWF